MTTLIRYLVKMFDEEAGPLRAGISFLVEQKMWLVQIRNLAFIADEAAIKATYSNKGASGMRPCLMCQNVLRTEAHVSPPFVLISESNYNEFQQLTDADVFLLADHLSEMKLAGVTAVAFNQAQKHSGLTFAPHGLLWDMSIRHLLGPTSANFDPMHIYFSGGIFGSETAMLFNEIQKLNKKNECFAHEKQFLEFAGSDWTTPALPSCLHANASQRERAASLTLKDRGTASQQLSMFPLLDCYVRVILKEHPILKPKVESYLQLCAVVRAVRRAKEQPIQSDRDILEMQRAHMHLFVAAWGREQVRPKHHFQFHLGQQALRWGVMFDCWCTERKHRDFKKTATLLARNRTFKLECLTKLSLHEEVCMESEGFKDGLFSNQILISSGKAFHKGSSLPFFGTPTTLFVIRQFYSESGLDHAVGELWQLES